MLETLIEADDMHTGLESREELEDGEGRNVVGMTTRGEGGMATQITKRRDCRGNAAINHHSSEIARWNCSLEWCELIGRDSLYEKARGNADGMELAVGSVSPRRLRRCAGGGGTGGVWSMYQ
ncbi:unnamed protein product, partial [Ectocarpus fasciculatus]